MGRGGGGLTAEAGRERVCARAPPWLSGACLGPSPRDPPARPPPSAAVGPVRRPGGGGGGAVARGLTRAAAAPPARRGGAAPAGTGCGRLLQGAEPLRPSWPLGPLVGRVAAVENGGRCTVCRPLAPRLGEGLARSAATGKPDGGAVVRWPELFAASGCRPYNFSNTLNSR